MSINNSGPFKIIINAASQTGSLFAPNFPARRLPFNFIMEDTATNTSDNKETVANI